MTENNLKKALSVLNQGGLVALPTETVYGLAADAKNENALRKIFHVKNRPVDHPLIVHIGNIAKLNEWARDISEEAWLLAKTFWPGPLTLVLKKAPHVSSIITGNQDTIGVRMPNHPLTLQLLNALEGAVAAPSANKFGRISPTTAEAVFEELGNEVDFILDGGQCDVGVESTIVDMTQKKFRILRPGMITEKDIENILHQHASRSVSETPRVSGSLESHYAPHTKTFLISSDEIKKFLETTQELPLALLALTPDFLKENHSSIKIILMSSDPKNYAHDIYQQLRELDKAHYQQILIEKVPDTIEWAAIQDRLKRAAQSLPSRLL